MEESGALLSSRLLSLHKNGQWGKDDVIKLFKALVKEFNGKKEDFHTWMMRILHQVEIHKIKVSDLTLQNDTIVDHVEARIKEIVNNTKDKTLDEILEEIEEQAVIDQQTMAEVKDIVSSVSKCLSASSAPYLQGRKQILFELCKAVEKTKKYKPHLTQMVSWCILVLSESSRLVQVGTGEGKSCIVAMFAAYQAMMGKTPDIISSSPVLAERDAKEWSAFYKRLNITVDVNTNKSEDEKLKDCYKCQVVYGTTLSFAADWLRQRVHIQDLRDSREFQCVIVDEVDSLMLDKGLEVVYLSTETPVMESLNGILAKIWFEVNQLKRLDTGEILGPIQLLSQLLFEIVAENKSIDLLNIVQMAVESGITKQMQENMANVLQQLDNASVVQMVAFLTIFLGKYPEHFFNLYMEAPDGKLKKISCTGTNKRQEISVLLLGNGKCRLVCSAEDSLVKSLVKMIKKHYQSEAIKEPNQFCIPGLQDLINGKVQTWIENALLATKRNLGHEYVLHGDGVAPVDYSLTGVVQNNMQWGEGLQQFLEMKHQTKLSNMSLITNFMSNVGLFKRYPNQIYGITGTLGDQTELHMLKEIYGGIETCKIPLFRQRKLYELEGLVIAEELEWISTVCNVVKHQVSSTVYRGPRAALIICETINHAKNVHKTLGNTISKEKLKLYVNNNMNNSKILNNEVQEGDVIISTNLAGRGTDLKVCKSVNEAGGLFVVQTFLPLNVRVEQQAFGRTARQGSPGSAQLIMCSSHFSESVKRVMASSTNSINVQCCLINEMLHCFTKGLLDKAVNHYLENHSSDNHKVMVSALKTVFPMNSNPFQQINLEMAKVARNIEVEIRLSGFFKEIQQIIKKEELFSVYLDVLDAIYKDDDFSEQRDVIVLSLNECWGLWLLVHFSEEKDNEILKWALLRAKLNFLTKQSPSSMVYYYIRSGNNLREKGRLTESIEMYTKALKDGASGEIIPLYNRALATIQMKDTGYITQALADLEKADKAIDSFKSDLAQILTYAELSSQEQKVEANTLLATQFQVKYMILEQLRMNIQDAVKKLKRAESRGENVSLTEKPFIFFAAYFIITHLRLMKELPMELMHMKSLGLDTTFTLDTPFSFSGFLLKILK